MVIHRLQHAMILDLAVQKYPESIWPVAKQKRKVARQQWTPPVCAHTRPGQCETHSIGADTKKVPFTMLLIDLPIDQWIIHLSLHHPSMGSTAYPLRRVQTWIESTLPARHLEFL